MRAPSFRLLALALPVALIATLAGARAKDAPTLNGSYKLLFLVPFQEADLLLIDVKDADGKPEASIKEVGGPIANARPKITAVKADGADVMLTVNLAPGNDLTFKGAFDKDGKEAKGVLRVRDSKLPARLEKTTAKKLAQPDNSEVVKSYFAASKDKDPKSKVKKLKALVEGSEGSPKMDVAYVELLQAADAAGLSEKDVRQVAGEWIGGAKPYGDDIAASTRMKAVTALGGKKAYAPLAFELATEADKALGEDAPTQTKADVAQALAEAAKAAGKADVAADAGARAEKLQAALDAEYHEKVPPFKPQKYTEAKGHDGDRVVLMELFTGAQCPPCVAADVAFDALNASYPTNKLITLQYHLHIPGPDPLTNKDSLARQEYYGDEIGGTPTTLFNGKSEAGGGGPMDNSKNKYDEYRKIIDDGLDGKARASIGLDVKRDGDTITIVADAKADAAKDKDKSKAKDEDKSKAKDEDKKSAKKTEPAPRLRLVLVEKSIRYVGGNRLRFHHHVVRAMPGGAEGKALTDGKAKVETKVDLAEVRKGIEEYLAEFTKGGGAFPNGTPKVALEDLAVVAYVQDDSDKSVLHAVTADVSAEKK